MSPKTVIRIKREGEAWRIKTGKLSYLLFTGISRLFRELTKLIHDRDMITSIRIEILRKKKS